MNMNQMKKNSSSYSTVTKILNTSVKDFSLYTIYNRAIPSVVDGLKPVQRKILYACTKLPSGKLTKTFSFAGSALSESKYVHGAASMEDAINNLTASYNNVVPMLIGEGSFGSRLVPVPAASRYTSVKFNKKEIERWFKDFDIAPENPDPENPEPLFYLPIIPWVLVNGVSGIATGFATEIQPRNPYSLAKLCLEYINGVDINDNDFVPYYPNFNGSILNEDGKWVCYGKWELKGKTKLEITEVPIGYNMAKYISLLNKLKQSGKIVSFVDRCSKSKFNFSVTLPRQKEPMTDDKIISLFKLKRNLNENITVIDYDGNLKVFDSVKSLLTHFCDYRATMYALRVKKSLDDALALREWLLDKGRFIVSVINNNITFKNKSSDTMKKELADMGFTHIDRLLRVGMSSMCVDEVEKLKKEFDDAVERIKELETINPKDLYKKELEELLK